MWWPIASTQPSSWQDVGCGLGGLIWHLGSLKTIKMTTKQNKTKVRGVVFVLWNGMGWDGMTQCV